MTAFDASTYAAALRRDGTAFADAAQRDLGAHVPSCPEWNVADLVWHLTEVHSFWRQVADKRLQSYKEAVRPERLRRDALIDTYRAGLQDLVGVLETADPSVTVWTWSQQKDIAFIQRRMAQETAVHRWDAEAAAATPRPIDTLLAVDGIDEFFAFFWTRARKDAQPIGGSVHLHCTDAEGEWSVEAGAGEPQMTRGHIDADAELRGTASDLLLALWRRVPPESLEVLGDRAIAPRFLGRTDLD